MANTSCIKHPQCGYVHRREDYLSICDKNDCAAQLLDLFEYWTNCRLERVREIRSFNESARKLGQPIIKETDTWLYEKIEDFRQGLLEGYGETYIKKGLKLLKQKGFIEERPSPLKFDHTKEYRLICPSVQRALDKWDKERKNAETPEKSDETNLPLDDAELPLEKTNLPFDETNSPKHYISNTLSNSLSNTHSPPTPPSGGGSCEKKIDSLRLEKEEEVEAVAVEVDVVTETEEEIHNKIRSSVESKNQIIQTSNSNPGEDLVFVPARDNNAMSAQKLARINRNIELLESGKVEHLPSYEFNEVAEYVIGSYASLYRKSGKINNRKNVNDIKPEFLAYVEKNVLSSKLRNEGNAVKYVRNSERDPDRWDSLIADVKGWLKQEYKNLGQPAQTPKEKQRTREELRKMMLSERI